MSNVGYRRHNGQVVWGKSLGARCLKIRLPNVFAPCGAQALGADAINIRSVTSGQPDNGITATASSLGRRGDKCLLTSKHYVERELQSSSRKNIGKVNSPIATEVTNDDLHAIHRHRT
jgi:hypothetical protein